jgi:hypothetical protein
MSQKSALERIEDLEKQVQQVGANSAGSYALAESGLQKLISLEQSYAALAKTLHALISSLKESGHVSDEKVMAGIRKLDDDQAQENIARAVEAGVLKRTETLDADSIAITKTIVIYKDKPVPITVSNYQITQIPAPETSPRLRQELIGKKVGDTVKVSTEQFEALYVVVEAYGLAEASKVGDDVNSNQERSDEAVPQESSQ